MIIQIISGFFLAFYYVRGRIAWVSVVEITREVRGGWILRLIHRNTASFVFLVLFVHFFRGLVQGSFYLIGPWIRGWILMLLRIAAAFLGYVLPWGQISFWGATVIINLLSVLPMGNILVIWLWGGFYVSIFTCSFFYALHYIVPFVVLVIVIIHLLLLHTSGRSVSAGGRRIGALKIKFSHLFLTKDIVNVILLFIIWFIILIVPDWRADPVNFVPSDLSTSPLHIQPEWYFLHLYAILRSIPSKVGGLIAFVIAILILPVISITGLFSKINISLYYQYNYIVWTFIWINLILMWLGIQAVEAPFIMMGQVATIIYFLYLIRCIFMKKFVVS